MIVNIIFSTFFLLQNLSLAHAAGVPVPVHQLRIYSVPAENRQVFHERFRDHAHRIMKRYNFTIVAIWESVTADKVEFVYLLEWKDVKAMKEAWKGFMTDQEWKDIKAQTSKAHGTFVNSIEDRTLILTDYSPKQSILEKGQGVRSKE